LNNDADSARIQAHLISGGTAADTAEDAYRLCHINASLRRELDAAKATIAALLATNNGTAKENA
jgi:hypothetical protein